MEYIRAMLLANMSWPSTSTTNQKAAAAFKAAVAFHRA
jgi:hypothetical protein